MRACSRLFCGLLHIRVATGLQLSTGAGPAAFPAFALLAVVMPGMIWPVCGQNPGATAKLEEGTPRVRVPRGVFAGAQSGNGAARQNFSDYLTGSSGASAWKVIFTPA
jgi:hypothetical protein